MAQEIFDDETLMAFADGELDEVTAARVAAALADDPALAANVEMFRASRRHVGEALGPLLREPVPPGLSLSVAAMIERDREAQGRARNEGHGEVVSIANERVRRRRAPAWLIPAAAAITLMVGGSGGFLLGTMLPQAVPSEFASIDDPAIIQALSEIPSGEPVNMPGTGRIFESVLSFQLEDGTLCREYRVKGPDVKGVISIACREEDNWRTHLLMAATRLEEGFEPAGSAETIDAYLASIHAGSPLDRPAEDAALKSVRR